VPGFISLLAGREKFIERLDSLCDAHQSEKFTLELLPTNAASCIGEYGHE